MGRISVDDLCVSCRGLHAANGMTVERALAALYNDPAKWLEGGGDVGVVVMLNNAIVMGDGCTRCGEKVLNWAGELGLRG